jgi:cytochrome P450
MFMKNRVSDLAIFERWTTIMIDKFAPNGQTFDLQELFYRMTIDVITEFLLGESVGSLQNPQSKFVKSFAYVQFYQTILTVLIPIEKLIPRGKYLKSIKIIEEFITPFIDKTLSLSPEELEKRSKSEKEFTFLHSMAAFTRDPKVIRDQLIAVLLAGRDTTAATLSWAFYELSHSPKSWTKLRNEVLNVVGPDRQPTYEDLKNLKYVNNVLNETLRLYPAVPFNIRSALTDTTLPSCNPEAPDITVVKGDAVFYATIGMQRRQDLYPPPSPDFAAANVFQPERWEIWQPKPWQYVPFNGGLYLPPL